MMATYQICTFIDSKTAKGHLIGIRNCFSLIAPVEDHNYKLCSICFDLCDIIFQLLFPLTGQKAPSIHAAYGKQLLIYSRSG